MRRSTFLTTTLAVALAAIATPALAQDANTPPTPPVAPSDSFGDHITVGVGAVYLPDYEGSNNYRVEAGPVAIGAVKGFDFALIGNLLSIDLIRDPKGSKYDL